MLGWNCTLLLPCFSIKDPKLICCCLSFLYSVLFVHWLSIDFDWLRIHFNLCMGWDAIFSSLYSSLFQPFIFVSTLNLLPLNDDRPRDIKCFLFITNCWPSSRLPISVSFHWCSYSCSHFIPSHSQSFLLLFLFSLFSRSLVFCVLSKLDSTLQVTRLPWLHQWDPYYSTSYPQNNVDHDAYNTRYVLFSFSPGLPSSCCDIINIHVILIMIMAIIINITRLMMITNVFLPYLAYDRDSVLHKAYHVLLPLLTSWKDIPFFLPSKLS